MTDPRLPATDLVVALGATQTKEKSYTVSFIKPRRGALVLALALGALAGSSALVIPAAAQAQPFPAGVRGLGLDPIGDQAADALVQLDLYGTASQQYVAARDSIALQVANRVAIDSVRMQYAWAAADVSHQRALLAGLTQLGVSYRRNASKAGEGFDCSGLTTFAWGQAGVDLVRQSASQIRAAGVRQIETAQAGDLVYYPGHVMLWLGVDRGVLHSPNPGRNVEVKIQGGNKSLRFGDPSAPA